MKKKHLIFKLILILFFFSDFVFAQEPVKFILNGYFNSRSVVMDPDGKIILGVRQTNDNYSCTTCYNGISSVVHGILKLNLQGQLLESTMNPTGDKGYLAYNFEFGYDQTLFFETGVVGTSENKRFCQISYPDWKAKPKVENFYTTFFRPVNVSSGISLRFKEPDLLIEHIRLSDKKIVSIFKANLKTFHGIDLSAANKGKCTFSHLVDVKENGEFKNWELETAEIYIDKDSLIKLDRYSKVTLPTSYNKIQSTKVFLLSNGERMVFMYHSAYEEEEVGMHVYAVKVKNDLSISEIKDLGWLNTDFLEFEIIRGVGDNFLIGGACFGIDFKDVHRKERPIEPSYMIVNADMKVNRKGISTLTKENIKNPERNFGIGVNCIDLSALKKAGKEITLEMMEQSASCKDAPSEFSLNYFTDIKGKFYAMLLYNHRKNKKDDYSKRPHYNKTRDKTYGLIFQLN